jgi:cyclic pyranopterin phosphate synthase
MIVDNHGRTHDYLRISLTENCDLPEEGFTPAGRWMGADEVLALAGVFVSAGVRKIRLTGGEPLVRKDFGAILGGLAQFPVSLSVTTNGTRLGEFFEALGAAGVKDLNISLDTLQPEKFARITRRDRFGLVKGNIDRALALGFHVKVNMVVMKGLNEDELGDFVAWTQDVPVHVRFIEFMPFSGNHWTSDRVFPRQEMLRVPAGCA